MKKPSIVFTVINDLRSDQRMEKICSSLQNAGYEVTLVGRLLLDSPDLRKKPYRQVRLSCWFTKGKLFYLEYTIRLYFWLRAHAFEVYSAVDMDTLWPNIQAARKWKSKVVFDAHEYFSQVPEVVHRPKVQKFWEYWEHKWIPKVQLAYTVNESLARIFSQKYGIPFDIIRNVPFKQQLDSISDSERFILYQGALNKGRGLEGLINAMPNIPCKLKIAGSGELLDELKATVHKLKLQGKIEFLGFLNPEELKLITSKAYIGYNVSENIGLSYYYSLNNKFFDYIQSGLPALTNDFPEYVHHLSQFETGILVHKPEGEYIIPAVLKLLNSPEYYHHLKTQCQQAAEIWNWEVEEIRLIRMYEELLVVSG
jgi:glycosyltransferase involved in cell wall biosynthesis